MTMEFEQLDNNELTSASTLQMLLPEVLDVRAAGPLATAFLDARGHQMRIDASNVASVGAQCLQVIASAKLTWERDGMAIVVVNPSEPFRDALSVAGMEMQSILEAKVDE
jgi:chemotaxis protein CheX